ncbi:MAG: glycosyltransferase family 2 protein [Chthoniobacter sp.]|nr:glycosyltransferase family 2 protein [Chthoniobacter sp.]
MNRELKSLSVVVPGLNEADTLPLLYDKLVTVLGKGSWQLEIVFVDDGSTDGSAEICEELHRKDPRFQFVSLSRNFGHQRALTAGLDFCTGQAVVAMDADLQDPPEVVLEMIARWQAGVDVVYGKRRSRQGETAFKRATAAAYYRIMRFLSGMPLPADTGDFRLMDRVVVDNLGQLREQGRFMRGLVHWVGFRQEALLYDRHPRAAGTTKYPLVKMLRFAWDGITSFSTMPLRLATWCGFGVFVLALLLIIIYAVRKLVFNDNLVPGWTALFLSVIGFGGLQMFFIGLLGEYVARCFNEVKGRPLYLVRGASLKVPPRPSE